MLLISGKELGASITCVELINSMEEAFRIYEKRQFVMPDRLTVSWSTNNSLLLMPCVSGDHLSTKVLTVVPENQSRNKPVISGAVILNDASTGEILALIDGNTLTAHRTGAVTGVSIRHLARKEVNSVGLIGCGVQGFYQLLYACSERNIQKINVYDISSKRAVSFVESLKKPFPNIAAQRADSAEALVKASDIVITATTARKPVIADDPNIFQGKHFVAIGSYQPDVREYPNAIFSALDKVWIDTNFAAEESGDLHIPITNGYLKKEQIQTLGYLIQSAKKPPQTPPKTTFFKSVGMALFDLMAAQLVYRNALKKALGTEFSLH